MLINEIIADIERLKKERNAIIMAHNYQPAEIQKIADINGDSLELSIRAANLPEIDVVVFCSVDFMGETAKLLSPEKIVLLPDAEAFCPMAEMINPDGLRALKAQHPGVPVVCYVNSSAAVKAEADICCTSANAVKIVNSLDADTVIFAPDRNLGAYVARYTDKKLILWQGYCPVHNRILPEHVIAKKALHPNAKVIVHPECLPAVIDIADYVVSTGGMVKLVKENEAEEFIVGTEEGMMYRLEKEAPAKKFYHISPIAFCPNMNRTTLEKVRDSLLKMQYPIEVPSEIAEKAKIAIERMINLSR
ncbi:MAG: quinolinate synthase NadA [bacterium]